MDLEALGWELGGLIGLDPRPFTLRDLARMAAGAWDRTTALMSCLGAAFAGQRVSPDSMNPYRARPAPRRKPPAAFWDAVDDALTGT